MTQTPALYLVDDATDYRFLVQQVFNLFLPQYPVRFFSDGADLVASMGVLTAENEIRPNVIVLDIDMPRMNGLQTLTYLKQNPYWQDIPVVMMSNRREGDYQQESQRLGANAFILKPMDLMEIKTVMTLLCEHSGDFGSLPGWPGDSA